MKIFVNEPIHPAAMELLRSRAEVVSEWEDVPAVSASLVRTTKIGPDFLNRAKQLRVIGKHGIGYDNIDIASAKERGIAVVYTLWRMSTRWLNWRYLFSLRWPESWFPLKN
ncbi:MAG: hypothetical protein EP146_18795 [Oscillibacter sp.]|uniref:hypothetical protein n=1 Tax=Oscillibacter sp. TaxID=1945593 RepID=UPI00132AC55D|nr:hypothetical protein [Oscillibacter sp.]MUU13137.1 hypothetical protein [Oscillibacter sp.]